MSIRSCQIFVVKYFGLEEEFKSSNYGSYGWFLRKYGISVSEEGIKFSPDSPFKAQEKALDDKIHELFYEQPGEYGYFADVMISLKIGNRIAEHRKRFNLTQSQLGDLLGVSKNTISSYETGNSQPIAYHCIMLCIALGCEFSDLFYLY